MTGRRSDRHPLEPGEFRSFKVNVGAVESVDMGAKPGTGNAAWVISVVVLAIVGVLFGMSANDPHLAIPVVSNITCSFKGGAWVDSSLGEPAGCFRADSPSETPSPAVASVVAPVPSVVALPTVPGLTPRQVRLALDGMLTYKWVCENTRPVGVWQDGTCYADA